MTQVDSEFRQLFAQEATMRLARLGEELLRLEEAGNDPELIASVFRDAHTLKGAAAVVEIDEVRDVAHAMEDLLEEVRQGVLAPSPACIDALLAAVDGLSDMIPALLAGEDRNAQASALVAALHAIVRTDTDQPTPAPPPPAPAVVEPTPHPSPPRPARAEVETVAVPSARLDDIVRLVGETAAAHLRTGRMLSSELGVDPTGIPEHREVSLALNELQERAMRTRMVPVSTMTDQFHRAVRDLARSSGKNVSWEARGEDTELDRGVLQQLADPLLHLVRNAVDHGIETPSERAAAGKPEQAVVRLEAIQVGSEVIISVIDDGHGIDVARVRAKAREQGDDPSGLSDEEALYLVFRSGFSTAGAVTAISGRGVGLDVVRTGVEAVRGRIEIRSEPGVGTEFRIVVPITLAVLPCLLVGARGTRYAIPMHSVLLAQGNTPVAAHVQRQPVVWFGETTVPLSDLASTLDNHAASAPDGPVVVIQGMTRRHAFRVDELIGQRDVVVKGLSPLMPRLPLLAGASVEPDGTILVVLDAAGLIDRARIALGRPVASLERDAVPARKRRILVVDDAMTIRELERAILCRAGYDVTVAGDGLEALARLSEEAFDLVLSDVEMPRMDGFALTEAVRAHPTLANTPILILTSLASDEDRQRGLEAGADGYIVKSAFNEAALIAAVERVLGRSA